MCWRPGWSIAIALVFVLLLAGVPQVAAESCTVYRAPVVVTAYVCHRDGDEVPDVVYVYANTPVAVAGVTLEQNEAGQWQARAGALSQFSGLAGVYFYGGTDRDPAWAVYTKPATVVGRCDTGPTLCEDPWVELELRDAPIGLRVRLDAGDAAGVVCVVLASPDGASFDGCVPARA